MKAILVVLALVIGFSSLNSCEKGAGNKEDTPLSLTGKWYFTSSYNGMGGPTQWQPATIPNQWIELKANRAFSSNFSPFTSALTYQVVDSVHIKFISLPGLKPLLYFYTVSRAKNELQLSQADPVCIDGCALKFTK